LASETIEVATRQVAGLLLLSWGMGKGMGANRNRMTISRDTRLTTLNRGLFPVVGASSANPLPVSLLQALQRQQVGQGELWQQHLELGRCRGSVACTCTRITSRSCRPPLHVDGHSGLDLLLLFQWLNRDIVPCRAQLKVASSPRYTAHQSGMKDLATTQSRRRRSSCIQICSTLYLVLVVLGTSRTHQARLAAVVPFSLAGRSSEAGRQAGAPGTHQVSGP
jgi:hypothetical protein